MSIGLIMTGIGIVGAVVSVFGFFKIKRADEGEINKEYKISYDSIIQSKAVIRTSENTGESKVTKLEEDTFEEETFIEETCCENDNDNNASLLNETVIDE